jgi:lipopolysaccharide/colanic/teichoic acid biosynthesis glycosyltransferase
LRDGAHGLLVAPRPREVSPLRRAVDVAVVLVAAAVFLPVVVVLAILIKIDSPGPVFYRQQRFGAGGRAFEMLKLRTMVSNAASLKEELLALNSLTWPDFKIERDPRVTRVGRWIRAATLDELPQLWHVLRGDMTLVGPRASFVDVSNYELWQTERLEYRPGLFGSWQAGARGIAAFDDRCRMDIRDRRLQSLVSDVGLSVDSILAVLRRNGRH